MPLLILPSLIIGLGLQIGLAISPPAPATWAIEPQETIAADQQSPVDS